MQVWSDTIFSLSLIRPHLTFCMQLHLQNTWSQWWSSLMRTNPSNRTTMTTIQSRSSRLVMPQHPVSRHSHKYGTWWLNAHNPTRSNHDVFYLCSKWIYLIRHSDPQMEDSTTGELLSFHCNYMDPNISQFIRVYSLQSIIPVLIIARMWHLHTHRETALSIFQCTDWLLSGRDLQIESLKRDLELLRAELERIKAEVRGFRHFVSFRQEEGSIIVLFLL